MGTGIESALKMTHCVFDEISFRRQGFRNDNVAQFNLGAGIEQRGEHEYRVSVALHGEKKDEYELEVRLSGYFMVETENDELEKELVHSNAVAILVPYLRSEVSLLTAQPETVSEILPILNVYELMKD